MSGAEFGIEQLRGAEASSWATPLFLELPTGLSAPRLMAAVAGGTHMPYVELAAVHDGLSFEMARLRLDDVQWTHFATRDAQHDIVALTYDRLTFTWNNQDPATGMPSITAEGQWPAATPGDPLGSADSVARQAESESSLSTSTTGFSDALAPNQASEWTAAGVQFVDGQYRHRFRRSGETITIINDAPWQNPVNPLDTNGDGSVSPLDALLIINHLQVSGDGSLNARGPGDGELVRYLDVTGPNESGIAFVSPLDALRVINFLNVRGAVESLPAGESDDADGSVAVAEIAGPRDEAPQTADAALSHRIDGMAPDTDWLPLEQANWEGLLEPIAGHRTSGQRTKAQQLATDMAVDLLMHEWWDDAESGGAW